MDITAPLVISQILGLFVLVVLVDGIFIIWKSLMKLEESFRKPLMTVLVAFVIYVLFSILFHSLLYLGVGTTSYFWILSSIVGLIGSILLVYGGKRLLETIESQ